MTYLEIQDRVIDLGGYGTVDRDRIKQFINLAQNDIASRNDRWGWLEKSSSVVTSAGNSNVALPTDLKLHGRLRSATTGIDEPAFVDTLSFQHGSDPVGPGTEQGTPKFYSIFDGFYVFDPIPNAVITYTVLYWKTPTALSANSDVTELPSTHHDALVYGALMYHASRDKDPQMMAYWQNLYEGKIRTLRAADRFNQYESIKKIPMPAHYYGSYDY